jgi:hypothetical protein
MTKLPLQAPAAKAANDENREPIRAPHIGFDLHGRPTRYLTVIDVPLLASVASRSSNVPRRACDVSANERPKTETRTIDSDDASLRFVLWSLGCTDKHLRCPVSRFFLLHPGRKVRAGAGNSARHAMLLQWSLRSHQRVYLLLSAEGHTPLSEPKPKRSGLKRLLTPKAVLGFVASLGGAILGTILTWVQLNPANNLKIIPLNISAVVDTCRIDTKNLRAAQNKFSQLLAQRATNPGAGYGTLRGYNADTEPSAAVDSSPADPDVTLRIYALFNVANPAIRIPDAPLDTKIRLLNDRLTREFQAVSQLDRDEAEQQFRSSTLPVLATFIKAVAGQQQVFDDKKRAFVHPYDDRVAAIQHASFESQWRPKQPPPSQTSGLPVAQLTDTVAVLGKIRSLAVNGEDDFFVHKDSLPLDSPRQQTLVSESIVDTACFSQKPDRKAMEFSVSAVISMGKPERYILRRTCRFYVKTNADQIDLPVRLIRNVDLTKADRQDEATAVYIFKALLTFEWVQITAT